MKLNKSNFLLSLFLALFLCSSLILFVFADDVQKRGLETNYPEINGINITTTSTIETYAVYIFSFAIIIGTVLAFAVLIYGGFAYIVSSGNPEAMGDAKKWILGAIIGLILLLCSWLIIGIINKQLLSPNISDIEAPAGIYIVDKNGEKSRPYTQKMVYSVPEYIDVDHIEFISGPPENPKYSDPNKDELFSVFVYSEKNFKGTMEEIPNPGEGGTHSISNIGSMILIWWEPGVYLYDKENFETASLYPRFYAHSQMNLKEFDNKAKSLRIVDPIQNTLGETYYAILFEKPNFNKENSGRCGLSVANESSFNGGVNEQIAGTLSSIMIFKTKEIHGEVIIYDEIAQKAEKNEFKKEFTGTTIGYIDLTESGLDIWNSIAINTNATVVINTSEDEGIYGGYCRPFSQFSKDGDNLVSTSIYHKCDGASNCEEYLPKSATIFPKQE